MSRSPPHPFPVLGFLRSLLYLRWHLSRTPPRRDYNHGKKKVFRNLLLSCEDHTHVRAGYCLGFDSLDFQAWFGRQLLGFPVYVIPPPPRRDDLYPPVVPGGLEIELTLRRARMPCEAWVQPPPTKPCHHSTRLYGAHMFCGTLFTPSPHRHDSHPGF